MRATLFRVTQSDFPKPCCIGRRLGGHGAELLMADQGCWSLWHTHHVPASGGQGIPFRRGVESAASSSIHAEGWARGICELLPMKTPGMDSELNGKLATDPVVAEVNSLGIGRVVSEFVECSEGCSRCEAP